MELVANFILNNESLNANFDVSEVENFDALFEIYASGTTWGNISGVLSNQEDLQEALDSKASNERVNGIVASIDNDIEEINTNISDLQTTVADNYSELNTKIQNEAATRTENDNLLQGNINTLSDNLTAEISNRESADLGLQTQITNLSGTVSSNYSILNNKIDSVESDLQGDIDTLENAVNTNTNNISTLNTTVSNLNATVQSNYTILDTKINTAQTTLQGNIDTLSGTVTSNYNDLTQSITNNVSTLNTRITNEVSTLNGAISDEATARANADNNLQTQIDAIVSSSDVFDIVGTYAELQAYDISTVPVNDIIKVLVDSTHNNAATYYRCVENAGVKSWTYIGSEGAYYTKGEADSTFVPQTRTINNKQLNQNINLTASDVGALPVGTQIGNGTILLTQGGVQKGTFTLNQTGNATIDFDAVSEDITVDSELSTTSENPVQNKVITNALATKQDLLTSSNAGTDISITNRAGDTTTVSGDGSIELNEAANGELNSVTLGGKCEQRNLPSEYTQASYLYKDYSGTTVNTVCFDTGFIPQGNEVIEIDFTITQTLTSSSFLVLFGTRTGAEATSNLNYWLGVNGSLQLFPRFGTVNVSETINVVTDKKYHCVIDLPNRTISIDGNTYSFADSVISNITRSIYLFNLNGDNRSLGVGGAATISNFKIKRNNEVVYTAIPTTNVGIYDTVGGTLNTTILGTLGEITAGSAATPSPDIPLDIWCNNGVIKVNSQGQIYTDGTQETVTIDTTGGTANAEMLLQVGNYKDVQSILDGAVTRNIGVKVLDGTENWEVTSGNYYSLLKTYLGTSSNVLPSGSTNIKCTHYPVTSRTSENAILVGNSYVNWYVPTAFTTLAEWEQYLAGQYSAGTPVIIVYPLAEPTTESVTAQPLSIQAGTNIITATGSINNLPISASYNKQGGTLISFTNETGYITGIDSSDITSALGYVPYDSTNPNGYTSNIGTVTSVNNIQPVNGNVALTIPTIDIDDTTITTNASDELQAVALIDNNTSNAIKTWTGTRAQYDAIVTKDSNTLYNIIDDTDVTLSLLELIYPVGAIYIGTMSTCPLAVLGVGTWVLKAADRVLQGAGTNTVGDTVEAGLPNITGGVNNVAFDSYVTSNVYGAFNSITDVGSATDGSSSLERHCDITFDASNSSSIYGNSSTVQPPAYIVNIWERIS